MTSRTTGNGKTPSKPNKGLKTKSLGAADPIYSRGFVIGGKPLGRSTLRDKKRQKPE